MLENRVEVWAKTGFKPRIFELISHQGRGTGLRAATLIKGKEAEPLLYTRDAAPGIGTRHLSPVLVKMAYFQSLSVILSRF